MNSDTGISSTNTWQQRVLSMPIDDAVSPDDFVGRLRRELANAKPDANALNMLGQQCFRDHDYVRAKACFGIATDDVRAIGAVANLAHCEVRLGQAELAESRSRALVRRHPNHAMGWQALSEALAAQQRYLEAADALREAVELSEQQAPLFRELGEMLEAGGMFEAARDAYAKALALDPDNLEVMASLLYLKRRLFDWVGLAALSERLQQGVTKSDTCVPPFDFIAEGASAGLQRKVAEKMAIRSAAAAVFDPLPQRRGWPIPGRRLRIGFVSHGFGMHPTTVLTAALFERWRDSLLEVHLFATNKDAGTPERRRLVEAAHAFHDMSGHSSRELALRVQECGIEVLVDLNGYCGAYRSGEFAYRSAPVQVNWLGYPGTTGAACMDYVIADRFVLPPAMQQHHSERVVYLPRCYQSNDPTRVVGDPPSRSACGLPEGAVVYACFNAPYKLNPRSVERMLAVLRSVPGSVLWLLKPIGQGVQRLRMLAGMRGIAPDRLVFMAKLPHLDYVARYRHADLFLDTEHFNAHTTATDAIWGGCPVLTRPGDTFATRVAGSINHHMGMPELNVVSDRAFVAEAIRIGLDAPYRRRLHKRLVDRRQRSGLFDIDAFASDMQALLLGMAEHGRAGGTPEEFPGL